MVRRINKKMNKKQKQQIIREIILKYTLPDALKPQYDGMTAYELAGIILREIEPEISEEEKNKEGNGNGDR